MKHVFIILLAITVMVTGIFLPYVPGDYDYFAVGLSHIFQFAGFTALLLVPVGLIWLIRNGQNKPAANYHRYFRKAGLVIITVIVLAAALGAFASHNWFFALIILGAWFFLLVFSRRVRNLFFIPDTAIPYYFVLIPLAVLGLRMTFLKKAKDETTDLVIRRSERYIQDIEAYKEKYGYYPVSLLSTIEDYQPRIAGIPRFYYERNGDAYNLYFEQFSDRIGTQEIVMYNPLDEHEMTVHNQDLLRIAPQNILRGYHEEADLQQLHWKIFYFD